MSGGGATVGSGRRWGRVEAGSTRSVRAWQQRAGFDAVIVFEEKKGQVYILPFPVSLMVCGCNGAIDLVKKLAIDPSADNTGFGHGQDGSNCCRRADPAPSSPLPSPPWVLSFFLIFTEIISFKMPYHLFC
jgi:hypothetical protein